MSQGAVSIVMSRPNSAAHVDSSQATVPHSAPSAIWRLRACTIRPSAIMKTAKLPSHTRAVALCLYQDTYARKPSHSVYIRMPTQEDRSRMTAVPDV
jgi:hypothetical protein